MKFDKEEVHKWNKELEQKSTSEIISWVFSKDLGNVVMTSAFNPSDMILMVEAQKLKKDIPILFLETGYHFKETHNYVDESVKTFDMNLVRLFPDKTRAEFEKEHGGPIHDTQPDVCCHANKVIPLQKGLKDANVWLTALRRDQSESRKNIGIIELYRDDLVKVNPLAKMTAKEVYYYMEEHGIKQHPLLDQGYLSIGCEPEFCTAKVDANVSSERAGRWLGKNKLECGIHTFMEKK